MTRPSDGLYDPRYEHDACGVALVAKLDNAPTREVVDMALEALDNLEHRGAEGADANTGDGAGILLQLPDAFLRGVAGFELPELGRYGAGICFMPQDSAKRAEIEAFMERAIEESVTRFNFGRCTPASGSRATMRSTCSRIGRSEQIADCGTLPTR